MFDAHAHLGSSDINSIICSSNITEYNEIIKCKGSIGLLPQYLVDKEVFFHVLKENELNIGEVGLDKRYDNMDEQIEFLTECLKLNQERGSLLTLHCVKADGILLKLLRKYPQKRFIYHGFTGSYETAKEITKLGGIISLGLTSTKCKDFEKLLTLPFLLESDRAKGIEQEKVLSYVYNTVRERLNLSLKELEMEIERQRSICKA